MNETNESIKNENNGYETWEEYIEEEYPNYDD